MKKIFLLPLIVLSSMVLVFAAGYVVNNFTLKVGVEENLADAYYIVGDAGNYEGEGNVSDCPLPGDVGWQTFEEGFVLETGFMYPGEARLVCVRLSNIGEGDLGYYVNSLVLNEGTYHDDCVSAFGEVELSGDVAGLGTTIDGILVRVDGEAPTIPENGCRIGISSARTNPSA